MCINDYCILLGGDTAVVCAGSLVLVHLMEQSQLLDGVSEVSIDDGKARRLTSQSPSSLYIGPLPHILSLSQSYVILNCSSGTLSKAHFYIFALATSY